MKNISALSAEVAQSGASAEEQVTASPLDDPAYRARAEAAAEKFESFFIASMLKQMRETTEAMADEDSIFRNRVSREMLALADGQFADVMAGQRAFGIADVILRQLLPSDASAVKG
ncbi:MAG: hypothetical protein CGU28_06520 [Candidatus Dactylopiibacterium carminicum]|uniref:Flagellar protein FlgJ N-terminal domain-containing protein n=1 Tax=Candidatus Dactylopiibacterium carminicum TaxID=857335 RepID=A0A272EWI9_9RHOO|nr:rod-binding protein [Candidatus Dactylopiibacterium carminicum]KAF7600000.1 hypothetical protein BGI27_05000 [Candidatus Dactylopiibacterium carminicum]PAS94469.1 MAG: hypothetical protein CGU29_03940 [Candidatus Dactylopiibacterium carminicum]PAS97069.1 MAG: hypothetical protein CGU28_06520 [Candidatus Dactylopiibacterium carminicum]PAT00004.1 MAG: hypothetical protein BSR46_05035 [Candidatus Dactylopiibacterium carminicum]